MGKFIVAAPIGYILYTVYAYAPPELQVIAAAVCVVLGGIGYCYNRDTLVRDLSNQ